MRKGMLLVFSVVLLLSFFGMTKVAHASSNWEEWESRVNVPYEKVWEIRLNTPIKSETLTKDAVYVKNDNTGGRHSVELELSEDGKTIRVIPANDYTVGDYYTLYVMQNLKSVQGNKPMTQSIKLPFRVSRDYQIAEMYGKDSYGMKASFDSFEEAKTNAKKDGTEVIFYHGEVAWMPEGVIRTKKFSILYADKELSKAVTYVNSGAEMEYLETAKGDALKVRLAGQELYANPSDVLMLPNPFIDGQSYYTNKDGTLVHNVYQHGRYVSYSYGAAPDSISEGEKIYSKDGIIHFNEDDTPQFNQLSLKTETDYTAEDLNKFLEENAPSHSLLLGHGEDFVKAQEEFGVNALYLMAHAIHESAWGVSQIARDKNNFFGLNATDDNPYGNADEFKSVEANIMFAAEYVKNNYLGDIGSNFRSNGDFLGNKAAGMNVKYASDPYWGQKIAGYMYRADNLLGNKDRNLLTGEPDPVVDTGEGDEPQAGEKDFSDDEEGTVEVVDSSDQSDSEATDGETSEDHSTEEETEKSTSDSTTADNTTEETNKNQ